MEVKAFKIATAGPSDLSGLARLIDEGKIVAADVVCIIGKTEGNGGRNDFTRELAMSSFVELFSRHLKLSKSEIEERIVFSLSGGCEGVVSPHIVVFCQSGKAGAKNSEKRLAIGIGRTRKFSAKEIGRMAQVEETARVIKEVVAEMKVESPSDIHFVQMKGAIPSFSFAESEKACASGLPLRSDMVYSRGASALGAALALGEVKNDKLSDEMICRNFDYYSSVASCSAKPGLDRTEIMVMGMSRFWEGELKINHGVLQDMLDVASIRQVLSGLGIECGAQLSQTEKDKLVAVFAKSEADPRGTIRGLRHTMLTDDDISDTRYSRCVLGAVVASITGDPSVYISTRAEHHGPLGGGTIAIIAK